MKLSSLNAIFVSEWDRSAKAKRFTESDHAHAKGILFRHPFLENVHCILQFEKMDSWVCSCDVLKNRGRYDIVTSPFSDGLRLFTTLWKHTGDSIYNISIVENDGSPAAILLHDNSDQTYRRFFITDGELTETIPVPETPAHA